MEETIEFEFLSSSEQQKRLEEVMETIKRMHPEEVIAGTFDISDISFGRLSNEDIVYTLKLNDPNSPNGIRYEQYKYGPDKTLKKVDLPDEKTIEQYKATGNAIGLENQAAEYKKLENDETTISLANLREANSELIQTAEALGISPEEVEYYVKINGNAEPVIDSEKVKNVQQSTDISGNEMITTRSSMNDITGMNYASYKVVKQQNGVHVYGITQEGGMEDITSNFDVSDAQRTMSLMTGNGNMRDVSVVGYLRLKSSSSMGRDQAFGLCNNNGHVEAFYARGALETDKMIGRSIPSNGYSNESVAKEKAILEERFNKDITSEAKEAEARTSNSGVGIDAADNLVTDSYDIQDLSSQIETTADNYGIDADVLAERVEEELSDNPDRVGENVVEEVAEEMDEEQDHSEPEEDDGYDHEPGLGSPWGNIDNF